MIWEISKHCSKAMQLKLSIFRFDFESFCLFSLLKLLFWFDTEPLFLTRKRFAKVSKNNCKTETVQKLLLSLKIKVIFKQAYFQSNIWNTPEVKAEDGPFSVWKQPFLALKWALVSDSLSVFWKGTTINIC